MPLDPERTDGELLAAVVDGDGAAIDRSIPILRARLGFVFPGVRVSRAGNEIVVTARNANADTRARILALIGTTPRLAFNDWEANVIAPNGKTVAGQLQNQDPTATEISQGVPASRRGRLVRAV